MALRELHAPLGRARTKGIQGSERDAEASYPPLSPDVGVAAEGSATPRWDDFQAARTTGDLQETNDELLMAG
jgi:hypothetical protein